jgi:hypothetical protein
VDDDIHSAGRAGAATAPMARICVDFASGRLVGTGQNGDLFRAGAGRVLPGGGAPSGLPVLVLTGPGAAGSQHLGGGLRAVSVSPEAWRSGALPELAEDGYLIGINWTGPRLDGWEFTVTGVLNRLDHALREGEYAENGSSSTEYP